MGCSFKPVVNWANRRNKTGRYSIFIRVTVDRRSLNLNAGEKIEEESWSGKDDRWVKDSQPYSFEFNTLIRKKLQVLQQFEFKQKVFGNGITLEGLAKPLGKLADQNVFNKYVSQFIKTVKGKSLNTRKKYRTFERYLNEFNGKINFGQLNEGLFQSFASWLELKGLFGVTVHKYFDPFKVICKQAVKEGYLEKDSFWGVWLGVKQTKGSRVYLECEEITRLKNVKLPGGRADLRAARTYWLFCFYCGFYYSDLQRMGWGNVAAPT